MNSAISSQRALPRRRGRLLLRELEGRLGVALGCQALARVSPV